MRLDPVMRYSPKRQRLAVAALAFGATVVAMQPCLAQPTVKPKDPAPSKQPEKSPALQPAAPAAPAAAGGFAPATGSGKSLVVPEKLAKAGTVYHALPDKDRQVFFTSHAPAEDIEGQSN